MHRPITPALLRTLAACLVLLSAGAGADTLATIRAQGAVRVAVMQDQPPYSYRNSSGARIGLEVDLATDIANTLGVRLQLVPVDVTNRVDMLLEKQADLVLAGLVHNERIARAVELIAPAYYASGTNVLARKSERLRNWTDLAGVPVCSIQGAGYNRALSGDYGAELVIAKSTSEALEALIAGTCRAFAFTDSALLALLHGAGPWADYEMPLASIDEHPWAMAARHDDALFSALLSGIALRWHRSGLLQGLQEKWGIAPTDFVSSSREIYR